MDRVISELGYKGTILHRNYRKMTILCHKKVIKIRELSYQLFFTSL